MRWYAATHSMTASCALVDSAPAAWPSASTAVAICQGVDALFGVRWCGGRACGVLAGGGVLDAGRWGCDGARR